MSKYVDFDKFLAENKQESIIIKFHGKELFIPSSIPAKTVLILLNQDEDKDISRKDVLEILTSIFSKEQFEFIVNSGISIVEMEQLIRMTISQYNAPVEGEKVQTEKEIEEGNF